ncbi:MAG: helix-turn-helix domain-containing protein [Candidatus Lokiarchaeota archaeon]|nr:helix-turn-helix domain-containing protein [Candidatus Lokiarchaeota archaeon]
MTKEIDLNDIETYIKALHCPIRWDIIKIIKDEPKTSEEIYNTLKHAHNDKVAKNNNCEGLCLHAHHKKLKKPTLYYHLRELENAGLIEGKKLIVESGIISKEKQWELIIKTLKIDFK